jgi:hypothetical protein
MTQQDERYVQAAATRTYNKLVLDGWDSCAV